MPTQLEVGTAIDQYTAANIATNFPVVYGNVDDRDLSEGVVSYLKMRVLFLTDRQLGLGNPVPHRINGAVVFTLHVRENTGDGTRDAMHDRISAFFRSQVIGGATFTNVRALPGGRLVGNWSLTGVEIPFYFDDMT